MKAYRGRIRSLVGLVTIALSISTFGQVTQTSKPEVPKTVVGIVSPVEVQNLKLDSKLMGRELPYRVALPPGYSNRDETLRYPVVYLLHGLTGHYTNWADKTKLTEFAASHKFIIVMPEGDNGWYTDSATVTNDKYESYIIKELIPEIEKKWRSVNDRDHRFIAGLSMGGYGALKFGLKYPDMFSLVGSFSGALGAAQFNATNAGDIGKSIDAIYGADDSDTRKANDLFKLVTDMSPEKVKQLPFIYLSCGTEDFLLKQNTDFLRLIYEKKIPHEFRQHPGVHDWIFWNDQVREFLDVAERRLKKNA